MVRSIRKKVKQDQPLLDDKSKKRKLNGNLSSNPVSILFTEHGFVFPELNTDQNELSVDQVIFQQRIKKVLKNNTNCVAELIDGIEALWSDSYRFCFSVLPTFSNTDSVNSSRGQQQESLARLMLGIKPLQEPVGNLLLEKLAEASVTDELMTVASKIDIDLIHRIVSQFKWLDSVAGGSTFLLSKVFEILNVCDMKVQEELISCVPDLTNDENHVAVAKQLRDLLLTNSGLVPCILETLSNVNLKGELLQQIRKTVIKILSSASIKQLPSVIKFLQQSIDEKNGLETISEIRENICFSTSVLPREASTPCLNQKNMNRSAKEDENMIFDSIKCGIKFQILSDNWFKFLEGLERSKDVKIIDIYVMLTLQSTKNKQKAVESLIKNKIKTSVLSDTIVISSFQSHPMVFQEFIKEILLLSETFLRSNELLISKFGCILYEQAFKNFDGSCQQELIGALVTHIGSGYAPEIECSFQVLQTLVNTEPTKMMLFTKSLKGILDYVGNLSVSQIRSLFAMISILTLNSESEHDKIFQIIQKHLSSSTITNKRIGIIGSMMMFASMCKRRGSSVIKITANSQNSVTTTLPHSLYQQVINLLTMVSNSVKLQAEASSLFFDELANIVAKETLDEKVLNWISERIVSDFQDEFLVDVEVAKTNLREEFELAYDLDGDTDGGICVNILPLIYSSLKCDKQKKPPSSSSSVGMKHQDKLICFPAHFRLVRLCEFKLNNGVLEGIDALLGCPLVLFKQSAIDKFPTMKSEDQHILCLSLLYAANWIRELLNAFSHEQVDDGTRKKLVSRIKTLNSINILLAKCLTVCFEFNMPVVDYTINDDLLSQLKTLKTVVQANQFKKPKARKPKKKTASPNQTLLTDAMSLTTNTEKNAEDDSTQLDGMTMTDSNNMIDLYQFPASFRQLDINVFDILTFTNRIKDSEISASKGEDSTELNSEDINLLLLDLERKLEYVFNGNVRRSFLKQSANKLIGFSHLPTDVSCVTHLHKLLPSLTDILNKCILYYESLCNANDGMVDCDDYKTNESRLKCTMTSHLLKIFLIFLSWDGFQSVIHNELLVDTLQLLLQQQSNDKQKKQTTDIKALASAVIEHFSSFAIPNICASVTQVKILMILLKLCKNNNKIISDILKHIKDFLQQQWFTLSGEKEKGATYHEQVAYFLKVYLDLSEKPLLVIEEFCEESIQELITGDLKGDESTTEYSTLTKNSLPSYYRIFYEKLIWYLKAEFSNIPKSSLGNEDSLAEVLSKGQQAIKLFHQLNAMTKGMENRHLFAVSLKYSRLFFESILKLLMPLLDQTLRSHKVIVHSILKNLQQTTRALQHLCGHTKFSKDLSLTTHVPGLKKCLETFVFRVKAMLAYNNCNSAFWIGNLKNRDLKGNEIFSQADSTVNNTIDKGEQEESNESTSIVDETDEDMNEECSESF